MYKIRKDKAVCRNNTHLGCFIIRIGVNKDCQTMKFIMVSKHRTLKRLWKVISDCQAGKQKINKKKTVMIYLALTYPLHTKVQIHLRVGSSFLLHVSGNGHVAPSPSKNKAEKKTPKQLLNTLFLRYFISGIRFFVEHFNLLFYSR